ncbi:MAG TPA: DUF1573 domain-containing protein [Chryseosolibacter sp.]
MKKAFYLLFFALSTTVFAQQTKTLQFKEEVFDFGTISEDGGPVMHEFVFTNNSNRAVKILTVQASCGCTTPDWTKEAIQPGKNGFIQASYNPKGRPGFFNKSLTVTTDYEPNPIILQIKGQVSTDAKPNEADFAIVNGTLRLKSSSFNMGKVLIKDEYVVRDFAVMNGGSKPLTFSGTVVSPKYIKVETEPKVIPPGAKGKVRISYNGKLKNQYGFQSDNVEIHTDDETNPVKSFSVYATLEDYFGDMSPEDLAKAPQMRLADYSFDFGKLKSNSTVVKEVTVTNTGKKELNLKSIQGNCTCITASAAKNKLKPGDNTTVKIAFAAQDRSGTQQKAVTIYSDDPRNPVQRVTFTAYVD